MFKSLITNIVLSIFMLQIGSVYAKTSESLRTEILTVNAIQANWIKPPVLKIETNTNEQKFIKLKLFVNKNGDIV